ncbi:MAG: asparagine synthase-related protein [bacterium]
MNSERIYRGVTQTVMRLNMAREPVYSRQNENYAISVYGTIHNPALLGEADWCSIDKTHLTDLLNQIGGYFCLHLVQVNTGREYLANDIFGNYRLYLVAKGNQSVWCDTWAAAQQECPGRHIRNPFEERYFRRHNFTSGGRTMMAEVDKLKPATLVTVVDGLMTETIYLDTKLERITDDAAYIGRNLDLITSSLSEVIKHDQPTFLMFSGGIDSTYLACVLRELELPFTPLFVKFNPTDRDNAVDGCKASTVARELGLTLQTVEVDAESHSKLAGRAALRHPFDRAYAIPYEHAFEWLLEKYGRCNLINGQASDSIYCWGASGTTLGSLIQRYLISDTYFDGPRWLRAMISRLVAAVYRRRWKMTFPFRVPYDGDEVWVGLLDPQGYLPIVHTAEKDREYHLYLFDIVREIANEIGRNRDAMRMYLKLMYLQGPSNIAPIEAARAYGHNMVLPFVDARLVRLRRQYQSERRNLLRPRYVLTRALQDRYGFNPSIINRCRPVQSEAVNTSRFEATLKRAYRQWDQVLDELC